MMEATRISRAAYPNKLGHAYCEQRYGPLAPPSRPVGELLKRLLRASPHLDPATCG